MPNVQAGDMARMVDCGIPEAVGLIVDVLRDISAEVPEYAATHGLIWQCKAVSGAKSDQGFTLPGQLAVIPDKWLRPILPRPGADTARTDERLTAEA